MARRSDKEPSQRRGYWADQIAKATKTYESFRASGDIVVDKYRIEKAGNTAALKLNGNSDRYNILYSSTETIRPSLYAQTPKIEARKRNRDRKNDTANAAVKVLESCVTYAMEDLDFDETMTNVIEDYTLPGLGVAWVRYLPTFKAAKDAEGKPIMAEDGKTPVQVIDFEALGFDYIHWKDFLTGPARTWGEVPWVAKRVYMDKEAVTDRWGKDVANKLAYSQNNNGRGERPDAVSDGRQAIIWEIWHKRKRKVIWFSDSYADDVIEELDDPLGLKNFWPCPKPLRAISNTRTMVPRCFYSQYQAQAEEIDNLTARIRHLTNALQVRGVFDASMDNLAVLLAPTGGNKMIPVENWQQFVQNGGMVGSVQWVPIKDVAAVLMQLLQARDAAKAEIYEITGFSDIVRGVSKASETLGAQEIKTDWASARLKMMQKEVQRFCRDSIRIMAEIISEHFTIESLALYSGFELPPEPGMGHNGGPPLDDPQAQAPQQPGVPAAPAAPAPDPRAQALEQFRKVVDLLKAEKERCAQIGIETDSTILPDEAAERKDRMEFLGQIGAFLQQAGPMIQQFPDMRGLLAGIMMFTVRTFRASRPIEQEFERFQQMIENMPAQNPNAKPGDDGGAAAAQAGVQTEQIKQQGAQALAQLQQATETQAAQLADATRRYEIDTQAAVDREKEANRHAEKLAELEIRRMELQIKQAELGIKQQQADTQSQSAEHNAALAQDDQQHGQAMAERQQAVSEAQGDTAAQQEQQRIEQQGEANAQNPA